MDVKTMVDKMPDVLKAIKQLVSKDVLIGIPDSAPERTDTPITNAQIGYLMETGSPAANIPARPTLVPGVLEVQDKCAAQLGKGAKAALDGKLDEVDGYLNRAGQIGQSSVRSKITNSEFVPLKPSTIRNRLRQRGTKRRRKAEEAYLDLLESGAQAAGMSLAEIQTAAGIKPLINTGQYRNAITYVVRKK